MFKHRCPCCHYHYTWSQALSWSALHVVMQLHACVMPIHLLSCKCTFLSCLCMLSWQGAFSSASPVSWSHYTLWPQSFATATSWVNCSTALPFWGCRPSLGMHSLLRMAWSIWKCTVCSVCLYMQPECMYIHHAFSACIHMRELICDAKYL